METLQTTFIIQGGPVMYPLLLVSLLGFILFIERALFLHKGQIGTEDFLSGIRNLVGKKRLVEALTLCEETPSPLARIVKAALLHFGEARLQIASAIQAAAIIELPRLERRLGTIAVIARIAPLLGFLGTLIAALQALYILEAANADSARFSQLLAEALITSATGLAIAVMGTLAHHFLLGRVRAILHDIEWVGHDILEFLTVREAASEPASASERSSQAAE